MTIHALPVPLRDNSNLEFASMYYVPPVSAAEPETASIEMRSYGGNVVDGVFVRDPDIGIQVRTMTGGVIAGFFAWCEAKGNPVDENHGVLFNQWDALKYFGAIEYAARGIEIPA